MTEELQLPNLRGFLEATGYNGYTRLTADQLTELVMREVQTFTPEEKRNFVLRAKKVLTANDIVTGGARYK